MNKHQLIVDADEYSKLTKESDQFKTVYREFNNLLCQIGHEGSIDADSRFVWDAMQALKKIDGGVYGEQFAAGVQPTHEGWQLVPIAPTRAMLQASEKAMSESHGRGLNANLHCYRAMLESAMGKP